MVYHYRMEFNLEKFQWLNGTCQCQNYLETSVPFFLIRQEKLKFFGFSCKDLSTESGTSSLYCKQLVRR